MKNWEYIIIHHSATPDGKFLPDFDAIKKFHMSYRYGGEVVSKEKAEELMATGKRVTLPWKDIAYHYVLEYVNGVVVAKEGRNLNTPGAHCVGMNSVGIGVCLIGNFDIKEPDEEQYQSLVGLVAKLQTQFSIPIEHIRPHHYYAAWKSCPGNKFSWTKFILKLLDTTKVKYE